eukprot:TRINITY_DN13838_c0_g1_i1.p1 TRINITY_DN13838_c0_g1~~TRINITY_DN13838_c0_g1_i1.p1  ORF type:complete len:904 (+),score=112.54 TRINITY_DN13838_c0_g1_i1:187-2898(+)
MHFRLVALYWLFLSHIAMCVDHVRESSLLTRKFPRPSGRDATVSQTSCSSNLTVVSGGINVTLAWTPHGVIYVSAFSFAAPTLRDGEHAWTKNLLYSHADDRSARSYVLSTPGVQLDGPDTRTLHSHIATRCPNLTLTRAMHVQGMRSVRHADGGGLPSLVQVQAGESVRVDISDIVIGYWWAPFAVESWTLTIQSPSEGGGWRHPAAPRRLRTMATMYGGEVHWRVERRWIRPANITGSRLPSLAFRTQVEVPPQAQTAVAPYIYQAQVAGFLDTDLEMSGATRPRSGLAGSSASGMLWGDRWDGLYMFHTPSTAETFKLAPSGAAIVANLSVTRGPRGAPGRVGHFYAKRPCDGTCGSYVLGVAVTDPMGTSMRREAGMVEDVSWGLRLEVPSFVGDVIRPTSRLAVSMAEEDLLGLTLAFADVHNQWMGFIFGNNPASSPCIHEMAFFAWIQQVYAAWEDPVPPAGARIDTTAAMAPAANAATRIPSFVALTKFVDFVAFRGTNRQTGYVMPRWMADGFYNVEWGPLHDQVPHFVLAVHAMALQGGDKDAIRKVWPAVLAAARYLQAGGLGASIPSRSRNSSEGGKGVASDGPSWPEPDAVFVVPGQDGEVTTGFADGARHATNWYDVVDFGHKDAIVGMYAVAAAKAVAEIAEWLGENETSTLWHKLHATAVEGFTYTFWDEEAGYFSDWVDANGRVRRYFYTDSNLGAIALGIATPRQSRRILAALDNEYAHLAQKFNVTVDDIYSTPCNMVPLDDRKLFCDPNQDGPQPPPFPNYEDGLGFFHTLGFELLARARSGDAEGAYRRYALAMRKGFKFHRFWAQHLNWAAGGPEGGDFLNNALLILWGFLRGAFGVHSMSLSGGIQLGPAAPQMEGGRWTFVFAGQETCVTVRGGEGTMC